MEVLSLFFENKAFVKNFETFLLEYKKLNFVNKDEDTLYFENPKTKRNEIYFHFLLNDLDYEFSYNYSEEDIQKIKNGFRNSKMYSFDIQYKDEEFLQQLIIDLKKFIVDNDDFNLDKILISHPHKGIMKF
jgi:hypothetical protein